MRGSQLPPLEKFCLFGMDAGIAARILTFREKTFFGRRLDVEGCKDPRSRTYPLSRFCARDPTWAHLTSHLK